MNSEGLEDSMELWESEREEKEAEDEEKHESEGWSILRFCW